MLAFLCLIIGFILGYILRGSPVNKPQPKIRTSPVASTQQQRLYLKAMHQTDSQRIRELNLLSSNQSVFLRLLKQTFPDYEVAIKQQRFLILDQDHMPLAIFEYRDGIHPIKLVDQEDGIPLHFYKALLSSEALKEDTQALNLKFQR